MILKIHHTVRRDCRTFGVGERAGFAGPKRVTAVEVSVQQIGTSSMSSFHGIGWQFSLLRTLSFRTVLGFVFEKL